MLFFKRKKLVSLNMHENVSVIKTVKHFLTPGLDTNDAEAFLYRSHNSYLSALHELSFLQQAMFIHFRLSRLLVTVSTSL